MDFINKHKIKILENAFSYIIVMAMLAYGIGKIVQFNGAVNTNLRISEMTGMQLMWAFYGYSKPFVYTLGVLEVIGGILLLLKRTRLIGCMMVSTMLLNIIIQDIFYKVNVGALKAAILYQLLILFIFYFNRDKISQTWKILTQKEDKKETFKNSAVILFISGILFVLVRVAEYYVTIKW